MNELLGLIHPGLTLTWGNGWEPLSDVWKLQSSKALFSRAKMRGMKAGRMLAMDSLRSRKL